MSFKEELQEISGVGEATADKILDVVDEHSTNSDSQEAIQNAVDELDEGRPGYARKFLERALE